MGSLENNGVFLAFKPFWKYQDSVVFRVYDGNLGTLGLVASRFYRRKWPVIDMVVLVIILLSGRQYEPRFFDHPLNPFARAVYSEFLI